METIEKLKKLKLEVFHSVDDLMSIDLSADQLANLISIKLDAMLEIDSLISAVQKIVNNQKDK